MLDPFVLDALADSVVGFTISYDLPPEVAKRARDFTDALYAEVSKLNRDYDTILGIKEKDRSRAMTTA